ncbi:MAG: FmdB family zinc ribbon protein [Ignavibacteria bacterium]
MNSRTCGNEYNMPVYEYLCQNCGHQFDELQTISEAPLVKCPKCSKDTLKKLIGTSGGIIFKGSGFYLTDYKKTPKDKTASEKDSSKTEKPIEKPSTKPKTEKEKETKSEKKE